MPTPGPSRDGSAHALELRGATTPRSSREDRKSTRLNSSHGYISYAVFCLKKKNRDMTKHWKYEHLGLPVVGMVIGYILSSNRPTKPILPVPTAHSHVLQASQQSVILPHLT